MTTPTPTLETATASPPLARAVQATGVTRVFGTGPRQVAALQDVDLTVAPGEFVSLIGPSGCGKSTLLRLVADLDSPTSGTVEVFGHSARTARENREYGIAFQQAGLLPWRSVRANVELPLQLAGTGRAARRERADELLDLVGLSSFAQHHPDQLSGGMQQRVAIARALALEPSLLLMDEPFGALDEMTREHLQTQLLRICARSRAAVVFVTHSIPEAVFLSDRVVVMSPRPGRIREIVPVGLDRSGVVADAPPGARTDDAVRNDPAFFAAVAAVRDSLHGAPTARGTDL
ncbi:ABC transporter ATP-binding protein [Cellulomonas gilvus]|uniref:ABC transporter related protein n=1 Tax=Cellulomonas gilvus (strain ATCC 13127 / NRRL B-14078) TaxID=593907 RepID=F8A078_CELGA|nr:ABC transporter ATP-binding protein [Cellulomonas gilvus]AEI12642.1 ABC transporter related protein [Cellulomonas gilvus ATCC 13127]